MAPDPVSSPWPVFLLPVSLGPDLGCWQLEERGFCPQLEWGASCVVAPSHFVLEGHPLALAQKAELMEGKHLRGRGTPSGWGKWELGGGRLGRQSAIFASRSHRCPGKAGRRRLEWCQLGLGGSWAQSWALGVPRGIGPSRLGLLLGAWERAAPRPGTRGLSSEP